MSRWTVILPVKHAPAAKSRLTGIPANLRIELAQAFFADVFTAVLATPEVERIIIVGDADVRLPDSGRDASGADVTRVDVIPDPEAGLNAALTHACELLTPDTHTMALMTDLPALTSVEIQAALAAAEHLPRSLVSDADGTGTTALMSHDPAALDPHFGVRSRAAHVQSGAVDLPLPNLARMRRDVDTAVGLWDAERLGVGAHTRDVLHRSRATTWQGATCLEWSPAALRRVVLDDGRVVDVHPEASVAGFVTLHAGQRVEVDLHPDGSYAHGVRWPTFTR